MLETLASDGSAEPSNRTPYGQKYLVRGIIRGEGVREVSLVTVWLIRAGEDFPRFITAYPAEAKDGR